MRSRPRLSLLVTFTALSLMAACSAQQKAAFNNAMTGSNDAGGIPTATSAEGVTGQVAGGAAVISAGTAGSPASGIAAIVAAVASGLLLVERAAVGIASVLPNSKGSPSQSSSASGGGQSSSSGAQSSSSPLRPAA